jgi:hypothetical protein
MAAVRSLYGGSWSGCSAGAGEGGSNEQPTTQHGGWSIPTEAPRVAHEDSGRISGAVRAIVMGQSLAAWEMTTATMAMALMVVVAAMMVISCRAESDASTMSCRNRGGGNRYGTSEQVSVGLHSDAGRPGRHKKTGQGSLDARLWLCSLGERLYVGRNHLQAGRYR